MENKSSFPTFTTLCLMHVLNGQLIFLEMSKLRRVCKPFNSQEKPIYFVFAINKVSPLLRVHVLYVPMQSHLIAIVPCKDCHFSVCLHVILAGIKHRD